MTAGVLIAALTVICAEVSAFEVDGYRSGMTRDHLVRLAQSRGREVWDTTSFGVAIGNRAGLRIDGTFDFCEERLVSYSKSIDFDVEFFPMLQSFLDRHGQPQKVSVAQEPWTGPGGGSVRSVRMLWYTKNDRIWLTFAPEGRDGKGDLRHNRGASVHYQTKNSCWAF